MASMASSIIPKEMNEKTDSTKEKEKELDKTMTSAEEEEEYEEEEYEEEEDEEHRLCCYRRELELLGGALAPPPPFTDIPPQEQELLTSLTKDGGEWIDHNRVAAQAVHELSLVAQDPNGYFWTKDGMLNQQHYHQCFPRPNPTPAPTNSWTHSSRAFAVVNMELTRLVKKLTTGIKWNKLFSSIVFSVMNLRFLLRGSSSRNPDGSLQLWTAWLQPTTPLLPKRTFAFLRACKQLDNLTWVVADVPIDRYRNVGLPSGCLIRGMAGGFSQVVWVEHLQVEGNHLDRNLYTDLTCRGFAYGAERWVACLERFCERSFFRKTDILVPFLPAKEEEEEEDPWEIEKKSVMRLSLKMVTHFCSNISFFNVKQPLSCVGGPQNCMVYTDFRQSPYHNDSKEMVIISATTFTLPYSPDLVFGILGDEHTRHEWDLSGNICPRTKPTCYTTGSDPRNKIYVYQTHPWIYNEVVLQEASVTQSGGSLLVWSVLKRDELDRVKGGRGPCCPLIRLSGMAISSNHHHKTRGGGSIVTLGTQQEVHDIKEIKPDMQEFARNWMGLALRKIEVVLNKAAARTVSPRSLPLKLNPAEGVTAKTDQVDGSSLGVY